MKKFIIKIFQSIKKGLPEMSESFVKWGILALLTGSAVGLVSSFFHLALKETAVIRDRYPLIILSLPVCGLLIVALYKLLKLTHDKGTNMVLMAVRDGEKMTWRNTVSIFVGSVLTHIGGGSAGREGAALQIGGSIGSQIGLWLKLGSQDCRMLTMCGMSAGFSALFGTPVAAAFFSMEVISVGIMHYSALVPCIISALIGLAISSRFGVSAEKHEILFGTVDYMLYLKVLLIAVCCAVLSIIFCFVLKNASRFYRIFIRNPYLRIAFGGAAVVILTFICGTYDYNGTGAEVIKRAFEQTASWEEFALKLLFTALTLGAGFKGGEIMPVFFIGSTFGSAFAPVLGLDSSLGAAIGLSCLFCGVTNCPVTAVFLCAELFGAEHLPVYLLACGVSYMLSGYAGLYSEQKILYSKLEPKYIDKKIGK
ncbi:MAG: chloride channel protein [Oscillospiraceae bacterium]|nr:chloride channel protein [Oscillospiraceae bacterium]